MNTEATSPRQRRTASEVNSTGLSALVNALGVTDAARFLQQLGSGMGDYAADRKEVLDHMSEEEIVALVERHERSRK